MSDMNPLQPKVNTAPAPQPVPLNEQEAPLNRTSNPAAVSQGIDPVDIDLMNRAVEESDSESVSESEERDSEGQYYYDQILALIPEEDRSSKTLYKLDEFSKDMGDGFWDGYQTKVGEKSPGDLILSLFNGVEPNERAKLVSILWCFNDCILSVSNDVSRLQAAFYSEFTKIDKAPQQDKFAKLTIICDAINGLCETNPLVSFFIISELLTEMPKIEKPQFESLARDLVRSLPFLTVKIDQYDVNTLLSYLKGCEVEKRELIFQFLTKDFPSLGFDVMDLMKLFREFNEMSPSEWHSYLVLITDLSRLIKKSAKDLCDLLTILKDVDHQSIRDFFQLISSKLEGKKIRHTSFVPVGNVEEIFSKERQALLRGLFNYPLEKVASLLDHLKPHLNDSLERFSDLVDLLSILLPVESEHWGEAIALSFSSIKNLKGPYYIAFMRGMDIEQLRQFHILSKSWLIDNKSNEDRAYQMIREMESFTPQERLDFLSSLAPHMNKIKGELALSYVISGIKSLPAEERAEAMRRL